jgi:hypothetical protein
MEDYTFGFQKWREMEKSMAEKKYVVPEGMLKAACGPSILSWSEEAKAIERRLEAAFDWLSKNPIVPTNEQIGAMTNKGSSLHWGWDSHWREHTRDWLVEWQRRIILAPEKEDHPILKAWMAEAEAKGVDEATKCNYRRLFERAFEAGRNSLTTT